MNEDRGPWGNSGGGSGGSGGSGGGSGGGPRNPWSQPPRRRPAAGVGNVTSLDDFLRKSRQRFGGGLPQGRNPRIWLWGALGFLALWALLTSVHRIGPQERGVVTAFGSHVTTLRPGIGLTRPAPRGHGQQVAL